MPVLCHSVERLFAGIIHCIRRSEPEIPAQCGCPKTNWQFFANRASFFNFEISDSQIVASVARMYRCRELNLQEFSSRAHTSTYLGNPISDLPHHSISQQFQQSLFGWAQTLGPKFAQQAKSADPHEPSDCLLRIRGENARQSPPNSAHKLRGLERRSKFEYRNYQLLLKMIKND